MVYFSLPGRQTGILSIYIIPENFFVEVYFSIKSEGVDMICSFTNLQQLEPYLDNIDIGSI
jgi:hypothetical protein